MSNSDEPKTKKRTDASELDAIVRPPNLEGISPAQLAAVVEGLKQTIRRPTSVEQRVTVEAGPNSDSSYRSVDQRITDLSASMMTFERLLGFSTPGRASEHQLQPATTTQLASLESSQVDVHTNPPIEERLPIAEHVGTVTVVAEHASVAVSSLFRVTLADRIVQGQRVRLLVEAEASFALPAGTEVDIVIVPSQHFELESPSDATLVIAESGSVSVHFQLLPISIGTSLIRILCFLGQAQEPIETIRLQRTIIQPGQLISADSLGSSQVTFTQPDLRLRILEDPNKLSFELWALNPSLGLNDKSMGTIPLEIEPSVYFKKFFEEIEALPLKTPEQRAIAVQKLASKGDNLFGMLPKELGDELCRLVGEVTTLQVVSREPGIPWELIRLPEKKGNQTIGGRFLCEAFAMTRWITGRARYPDFQMRYLGVIVPRHSGLKYANEERKYLCGLSDRQREVITIGADYRSVTRELARSQVYDAWHFTGHGESVAPVGDGSSILLEDAPLSAGEIAAERANCGLNHPLVFLNACHTGHETVSLTGVAGWADNFIAAGVGAFIGTLWSVYDEPAFRFAETFYKYWLGGRTIAEAAREARRAIRPLDELTWLAYTVFADPLARVR